MKKFLGHILSLLLVLTGITAWAQNGGNIAGRILDSKSGSGIPGAVVVEAGGGWAVADSAGRFSLRPRGAGEPMLTISSLGYRTMKTPVRKDGKYALTVDAYALDEVVVTATESRGVTSVSRIGEDAISHIQPSSFADLLELLPGGMSQDPVLSNPQVINLRSATEGVSNDYATTALGTSFMIDGKKIGNDASLGTGNVGFGTDMREITTEDIESVDVVRGIASVEYGDLTSGLVRIQRKKGGHDVSARFKADMESKLFYLGKGFEWGDKANRTTLNASVNYLDSQADPREPRQSWKRLTGSLRAGRTWTGDRFRKEISASLDYTGSFDNEKSDEDLDKAHGGGPMETFRSSYHDISFGADFTMTPTGDDAFFRRWNTTFSVSYEKDETSRWKYVANGTETPISISTEPGEYDAIMVPAQYEATLDVDGRPFYANFRTVADFRADIHRIKAGAEWNMDKNFGDGDIFDVTRPISSTSYRPRPYNDIPATHQFSLFAEENGEKELGVYKLSWTVGLRAEAMGGAGGKYSVNMRPYLDPRANIRLDMPSFAPGGYKLDYGFYGGVGYHTKFPTMDLLWPDPIYGDISELNYWPKETSLRRILMLVYKIDPTNYELSVARNLKWKIGADASWNGFTFSVDYFRENMTSGFRYSSEYASQPYRNYDESAVKHDALTGPPSVENFPFVADTSLFAYSFHTNGSQTLKQGIEWTFTSKRIKSIGTRITANGAWFLTRNNNSQPEYYRPAVMISGKAYPYIGVYDKNEGTIYRSMTSNIMFDTQIPRLGLIFTTSFQAQWFYSHKSMRDSKYPDSYIDKSLQSHPFLASDADKPVLRSMVREFKDSFYQWQTEPFYMNVNLKVSKKLYHDKISCSFFVNRIFDITPDYHRDGVLVRRNTTPYFGMELNFKI